MKIFLFTVFFFLSTTAFSDGNMLQSVSTLRCFSGQKTVVAVDAKKGVLWYLPGSRVQTALQVKTLRVLKRDSLNRPQSFILTALGPSEITGPGGILKLIVQANLGDGTAMDSTLDVEVTNPWTGLKYREDPIQLNCNL